MRPRREDIAQEAFLRLWDKAAQWRPGGPGGRRVAHAGGDESLARPPAPPPLRQRRAGAERADETPGADAAIEQDEAHAAVRPASRRCPNASGRRSC
jgi:hypothetical protein